MKKILVIIDMINGFVKQGALADPKINQITPNIIKLIKEAKKENVPIINFRDCHSKNDSEFEVFPEHCLKGSYESELIDELKPYQKDFAFDIEKDTTNGFVTYTFGKLVENYDIEEVTVVGCCTDICVKNFVNSYLEYAKKHNKKLIIRVVADACATFDGKTHNANLEHNKALYEMYTNGAKILKTENVRFGETKKNAENTQQLEKALFSAIKKRDKVVAQHYGNELTELLNYPEERVWYTNNVYSYDKKIIELANTIVGSKKFTTLAQVYADSQIDKIFKKVEKQVKNNKQNKNSERVWKN